MKITILIFVLLIITAGCGGNNNTSKATAGKPPPIVKKTNNEPDGGPCTFANFTGILTVKELRNLPVKEDPCNSVPGPDKYFTVVFDYQADGDQVPAELKNFTAKWSSTT